MDIDQKNPWIVSELDPLEEMEFTKVTNSKSKVWEHFTKNAHFQKAKCNDCGKILSITQGSTKSLIGHLRNKHKIVLESSTKHPTKVKEEILDQINDDDNYYLEQTMEEYAENPYDQLSTFQNDDSTHFDNSYQNYQHHAIFHNNAISINTVPKTKIAKKKGSMNVKCVLCDISFSTKSSLDTHVKAKHLNGEQRGTASFQCSHCPQSFSFERYLKLHIDAVHNSKPKMFQCSLCQDNFISKDELKSHMNAVHKGEKNFQCDQCTMMFGLKTDLNKHKYKVHKIDKSQQSYSKQNIPMICDLCGKEFAWTSSLKEHKKMVHEGRTYPCPICNKGLSTKLRVTKHVQTVHEGRTDHMCSECGKSFSLKEHLLRHIKHVHEGIKNHECHICGKKFGDKANLRDHIKGVHEKVKDHKCDLCDQYFVNRWSVNAHKKKSHNINNYKTIIRSDIVNNA